MGGNGRDMNREQTGSNEIIGLLRQFLLKFRELTFRPIEAFQIGINGHGLIPPAY